MGREACSLGTDFAGGEGGVGASCSGGERISSQAQREGSTLSGLVTLEGQIHLWVSKLVCVSVHVHKCVHMYVYGALCLYSCICITVCVL